MKVRVNKKKSEAIDICSYELVAVDGGHLPAFDAGAHIDIHLPNGLVRQYSLCNTPSQRSFYRIAVLRDQNSRGGSQAMHDLVNAGDTLTISAPRNLFQLKHGDYATILVAGGIGVTPLVAMAYQLHELSRPFELHYYTRSRQRTAFLDELQRSEFSSQVTFHFDDEPKDTKKPVTALLEKLPNDTQIYTCGPSGFLTHVLDCTRQHGWALNRVHYETFSPPEREAGGAFEIRILSTGQSTIVGLNETAVSAVARLGIEIPVSCEQGICGTCLTKVLDGVPDHKDQFLTDEEHRKNDQFTPCCSRALSSVLVLDL
jgi:vanillate monooxygenase ferredoxin subunit